LPITSAAEHNSGNRGGSNFSRYRFLRPSSMTNPGVIPSLLAPTIRHDSFGVGGVVLPGPRSSSAIDILRSQWRLVYQGLSGTSPNVLTSSAGRGPALTALPSRLGVT